MCVEDTCTPITMHVSIYAHRPFALLTVGGCVDGMQTRVEIKVLRRKERNKTRETTALNADRVQ